MWDVGAMAALSAGPWLSPGAAGLGVAPPLLGGETPSWPSVLPAAPRLRAACAAPAAGPEAWRAQWMAAALAGAVPLSCAATLGRLRRQGRRRWQEQNAIARAAGRREDSARGRGGRGSAAVAEPPPSAAPAQGGGGRSRRRREDGGGALAVVPDAGAGKPAAQDGWVEPLLTVPMLFRILKHPDAKDEELDEAIWQLCEGKTTADHDVYRMAIEALCQRGSPHLARRLLLAMWDVYRRRPDQKCYEMVITKYSISAIKGREWVVWDLLEDMRRRGIPCSRETYSQVMRSFAISEFDHKIFDVWEMMKDDDMEPTAEIFSRLISACAERRDAERAARLFDEMLDRELRPTPEVFGALLAVCRATGAFDKAMDLFKRIDAAGMTSEELYVRMFYAAQEAGSWEDAVQVYKTFLDEELEETTEAGQVLIHRLVLSIARNNEVWQDYLVVFGNMIRAELKPGFEEIRWAFQAAVELDDNVGLKKLLAFVKQNGFPADSDTLEAYSSVILYFLRTGEWSSAKAVVEDMHRLGAKPEHVAAACALGIHQAQDAWEQALDFLTRAQEKDLPIDARSYDRVIACLSAGGKADAAAELRAQSKGSRPASFLRQCQEDGPWEVALQTLQGLKTEYGFELNSELAEGMLQVLERAGQWSQSLAMLEEMEDAGLEVDAEARLRVVAAMVNAGAVRRAHEKLEEVMSAQNVVDAATKDDIFDMVICAYEQAGDWEQTLRLYDEVAAERLPRASSHLAALRAAANGEKWQQVLDIFDLFRQECIGECNLEGYVAVLHACRALRGREEIEDWIGRACPAAFRRLAEEGGGSDEGMPAQTQGEEYVQELLETFAAGQGLPLPRPRPVPGRRKRTEGREPGAALARNSADGALMPSRVNDEDGPGWQADEGGGAASDASSRWEALRRGRDEGSLEYERYAASQQRRGRDPEREMTRQLWRTEPRRGSRGGGGQMAQEGSAQQGGSPWEFEDDDEDSSEDEWEEQGSAEDCAEQEDRPPPTWRPPEPPPLQRGPSGGIQLRRLEIAEPRRPRSEEQ